MGWRIEQHNQVHAPGLSLTTNGLSQRADAYRVSYLRSLRWRVEATSTEVYRLKEFEPAARALGMQLRAVNVESLEDFVGASAELDKKSGSGPRSLIFTSFSAQRTDLVAFAAKCRLPAIYHQSGFIVGSPDFRDLFRRSAT